VFVQTSQSPELPEGEYYYHQLIGMMGKDEAGNELGLLDEIIETGANDVYVFKKSPTDEVLIPAVDVFIKKIDLEAKEIIVSPPEWS
jgi:16S rRNA processing protein RimM